jgi:hypothetical protein
MHRDRLREGRSHNWVTRLAAHTQHVQFVLSCDLFQFAIIVSAVGALISIIRHVLIHQDRAPTPIVGHGTHPSGQSRTAYIVPAPVMGDVEFD